MRERQDGEARRERRLRMALVASGTAAGLLLLAGLEIAFRVGLASDHWDDFVELHEYSELYGWTLRPGVRLVEDGKAITINAQGYRGRPVGPRPPPGARRVLLLGDSIVFGIGADDAETVSQLLDGRDNGLEPVNLAVQGYGLGQSLLKLEHEGLGFSPDVVVLNVCLANDVADTGSRVFLYDGAHPKPYFDVEGDRLALRSEHLRLSPRARAGRALSRHSRFFAWLSSLRPSPTVDDAIGAEHWQDRRERIEASPGIEELVRGVLARMRAAVEGRGASFIVVLHPDWRAFSGGSRWIGILQSAPELAGVPVIDLRDRYGEAGLRWKRVALDETGHLRPAGHRFVAELLERQLAAVPRP